MLHFVCRWWGGCHAMWAEVASNRWPSRRSPSNESLSHCWIFLHTFRFIFCFICYILFPVSLIPVILNYVLTFFQSQSLRNAKKDKRDAQKRISKDTETSRSISSAHSRSKVTESLIQVNPLRMISNEFIVVLNSRFAVDPNSSPFDPKWPQSNFSSRVITPTIKSFLHQHALPKTYLLHCF